LYTRPLQAPPLFCVALSRETSAWAGGWADGLLTTAGDPVSTQEKMAIFRENGDDGKPVYVQFAFSYGATEKEALAGAWHQWRSNMLPAASLAGLYKTAHFDAAGDKISMEEVAEKITVVTSMGQLHDIISVYKELGAERIILHNVNKGQETFINDFGRYKDKI
jgi:alkanesulfonate monooxygenase SsuD/methylene tetrahydromethanopterin reductase-like flavin-dependent oxidoreductase (luciferase family)